jgi:RNA polymerase sigma-70 factor (ECF subfamily)
MTNTHADFSNALVALLPRLRRFASVLAGRGADADDLVQDAIERAMRKRHQYNAGTRMDSWMYRIMQNAWIDTLRSRKVRDAQSIDVEGFDIAGGDGRTAMEAHFDLARTRAALAAMSQDQRSVVALVLVEGYSYREAADILGVPEGTVTSRLFRARTTLEAAVKQETVPPAKAGAQGEAS